MKRSGRGVTLLEVMFAVALLATVFLGAVSGLPIIFRAQLASEQMGTATTIGQRLLAQARLKDFSELESAQGSVRVPAVLGGTATKEQYDYDLEVHPRAEDLKDVTVTVRWTSRGRERQVVLQTLVFGAAGLAGRQ